jgi:glycosyltransferase involved in cell wall biosynthesis
MSFGSAIQKAISIARKLPKAPSSFLGTVKSFANLVRTVEVLRGEVEALKGSLQVNPSLLEEFERWKAETPIPEEPLVSVCVATYNRPDLLVNRCLRSILAQTYTKLDICVVGDGCTWETHSAMEEIKDPRVRFHNLRRRGNYPTNAMRRWMVAGTDPANEALRRARGDYITHLDDDDEFLPDRIERLVAFARQTKADFIWHPFWCESDSGWTLHACEKLFLGSVTTSSVFYRSWFKRIPWDVNAHLLLEPGDWNRFRCIKYFQPVMARYPEPLLRHYGERRRQAA